MDDDPIDLDKSRNVADMIATDIRRHSLKEFEADQKRLRLRQAELETQLLARQAESWPEAAANAQYLLRQFAETSEGRDAQRRKLIERTLGDLARLMDREGERP
jgi:hypothetical protein